MSLKSTFRALQYRNYRLFFVGQGTSLIGTWMQRVATAWLVYRLTNSAVMLGIVGFVSQIPSFLLSPLGGVLADRWNKRNILLVTQALAMVQAAVLAVLVVTGAITVPWIIVLNACLGIINAFDVTARQSFVVEMIEKKEDLGNAIALNSSMVNGARLVGPSITGILIASAGEGVCFFVNAASYAMIIVALLAMNIAPRKREPANPRIIHDFSEGFAYIYKSVPMRSTILLLALVSLLGMSYQVLMPVFAKAVLGGGPHTLGFLFGATGMGALIGAMYLASRKNSYERLEIDTFCGRAVRGRAHRGFVFEKFLAFHAGAACCRMRDDGPDSLQQHAASGVGGRQEKGPRDGILCNGLFGDGALWQFICGRACRGHRRAECLSRGRHAVHSGRLHFFRGHPAGRIQHARAGKGNHHCGGGGHRTFGRSHRFFVNKEE